VVRIILATARMIDRAKLRLISSWLIENIIKFSVVRVCQ
jgi:hypothetical protein